MLLSRTTVPSHGNLNTIQQTQVGLLTGGERATKLVTTDASPRIPGNLLMTGADGNAVDAGISGSVISVNETATVKVNGADVSFDLSTLVNGA